jgi:hypothetical protein
MKVGKKNYKKFAFGNTGLSMKIILEETKRKKQTRDDGKTKEETKDHNHSLMQTYSYSILFSLPRGGDGPTFIVCNMELVWKECVKPNRERMSLMVLAKISCVKVEFPKKLSCSYESLFIALPIIHIHPKELVLSKLQKPSFPT